MLYLLLSFFAAAVSVTADAVNCQPCHSEQVAAHARSNHARSLRPIGETEFARALPDRPIGEARGGFLLHYEPAGSAIRVTAERGHEMLSGVIRWAFGAGDQGVTPVLQVGKKHVEHRISFYPKAGRFDLTLGHQPGVSSSALHALGMPQQPSVIRQCFGCHTTGMTANVEEFTPGIQCVRCHPGAEEHARSGKITHPEMRPGAEAEVAFCGQCHRLEPPSGNLKDPANVRFQPHRLVMSQCYLQGGISCRTCHDPHSNARRNDPSHYNAQCISCHAAQTAKGGDCIQCHMPQSKPHPYLTFTDHYIRTQR